MSHRKPTEPKVRSTPPDFSHSIHEHSFKRRDLVEVIVTRQEGRIKVDVRSGHPSSHSAVFYCDEVTVHYRDEA